LLIKLVNPKNKIDPLIGEAVLDLKTILKFPQLSEWIPLIKEM